jgi:hypothetical protein
MQKINIQYKQLKDVFRNPKKSSAIQDYINPIQSAILSLFTPQAQAIRIKTTKKETKPMPIVAVQITRSAIQIKNNQNAQQHYSIASGKLMHNNAPATGDQLKDFFNVMADIFDGIDKNIISFSVKMKEQA